MITSSIVGTINAGTYLPVSGTDPAFVAVMQALDKANDASLHKEKVKGLADLLPFIKVHGGDNGYTESFSSRTIKGIEDGEWADAPTFKKTYEQWFMTKHSGILLKDVDISSKMIDKMNEKQKSSTLTAEILELTKEAVSWYVNNYIPFTWLTSSHVA